MVLIFSEGKLVHEFNGVIFQFYRKNRPLPQDAYLFDTQGKSWFRSDFTPVLLNDVPPNYRAMVLIYI